MSSTISILQKKSKKLITSYPQKTLVINDFLNNINKIRKPIIKATEITNKLDALLMELTWVEITNNEEKQDIIEIIEIAKKFHKNIIKDYVYLNNALSKKMFSEVLQNYKFTIDEFEESIFEVDNIFFAVRKDIELIELVNSI